MASYGRALKLRLRNRDPSCRRYDVYASDRQGKFFTIVTWESRQALDEHMQTSHFKNAAAKFSELLHVRLTIELLDPIAQ